MAPHDGHLFQRLSTLPTILHDGDGPCSLRTLWHRSSGHVARLPTVPQRLAQLATAIGIHCHCCRASLHSHQLSHVGAVAHPSYSCSVRPRSRNTLARSHHPTYESQCLQHAHHQASTECRDIDLARCSDRWAAIPIAQKSAQALAGPSQTTRGFGGGNFRGGNGNESSTADPALIHYLEANQGHAKFLVATVNSMTADGIILTTNKPVMAMGGFMGSDQILTTSQLATLVANGTVRFFLISMPRQSTRQQNGNFGSRFGNVGSRVGGFGGFGGFGGGFGNGQSNLTTWVTQHCSTVPANQWQSTSTSSSTGTGFGQRGAN